MSPQTQSQGPGSCPAQVSRKHKGLKANSGFFFMCDRAGLQDKDVIISINGEQISSASDVSEIIRAGNILRTVVRRGNEDVILTIIPEEMEPRRLT